MEQNNISILDEVQRIKNAYQALIDNEGSATLVISAPSGMGKTYLLHKILEDNGIEQGEGYEYILSFFNPKALAQCLIANDGTYVDSQTGEVKPKILVIDDFDYKELFIKNENILDALTPSNQMMIEDPITKENHSIEAKIVILTMSCIPDFEYETPVLEHFISNIDRVTVLANDADLLNYLRDIYNEIPLYGQKFASKDKEQEYRDLAVNLIISEWKYFSHYTIPTFLFSKVVNFINKNPNWEDKRYRIYKL